jgi:hypothetical protein
VDSSGGECIHWSISKKRDSRYNYTRYENHGGMGNIGMILFPGGFFLLAFLLLVSLLAWDVRVSDIKNASGTRMIFNLVDRFILADPSTGTGILRRSSADNFVILGGCNAAILKIEKE